MTVNDKVYFIFWHKNFIEPRWNDRPSEPERMGLGTLGSLGPNIS